MAQILLLELVGRGPDKPDNVVVVGDDDQSIYRFRGASYAAFERFKERFETAPTWAPDRPTATVASQPLLENRRSTGNILSAASRLIDHNQKRLKKGPLTPIKGTGALVGSSLRHGRAGRGGRRRRRGSRRRSTTLPEPRRWSDIAVLYRKHRHRDLIVERLRKQDIPYVVVGGTGLFAVAGGARRRSGAARRRQPGGLGRVRAAAFRRSVAPRRGGDPARSPTPLRGTAGPSTRPRWTCCARARSRSRSRPARRCRTTARAILAAVAAPTLWADDGVRRIGAGDGQAAPDPRPARPVAPRAAGRAPAREARAADGARQPPRAARPARRPVRGARGLPGPDQHAPRPDRRRDAGRPANGARARAADAFRGRLAGSRTRATASTQFIAYLDVYQQAGGDLDTEQIGRVEVEGVQLMTVYQAKGLEYEAVVVPRLVEGQFPDTREERMLIPVKLLKQEPPADFAIDEERRLLFVAMTRAKSRLLLTALQPTGTRTQPSRFVGELARGGADRTRSPCPRTTSCRRSRRISTSSSAPRVRRRRWTRSWPRLRRRRLRSKQRSSCSS